MEEKSLQQAKSWLSEVYDLETRKKVQALIDENSEELIESFYKDLDFGTGGMRGIMGVGTNRINKYSIGKATQGLANTLLEMYPNEEISVAIAFDCRNNSDQIARSSAEVLSANGIKVHLFTSLRPTPELSFAVRELGCKSGIVITASHNPKEYNGYKVYGEDGCQIVSPFDVELISKVRSLSIDEVNFNANEKLIHPLGAEMDDTYINRLKTLCLSPEAISAHSDLPVVFTGIHGTGAVMVPKALKSVGFTNVMTVVEQDDIDGNFPTVKSPNPEEPAALAMAIELAKKKGAELVMGTDPDADRVGIAIPNKQGEFELLNGNQTGALLVNYLITRWKELGKVKGKEFIAKTVVTTDLMDVIAKANGVKVYNTLTGFKHIGALIRSLEGAEKFIGGGEESYGYLAGDFVRDKDAVMSCVLITEMVAWAKTQKKDLFDLMQDMYLEHGFYLEDLISITKQGRAGLEEISNMMDDMRSKPPKTIVGEEVVAFIDYLDTSKTGLPASNVLQFITQKGTKVTARPSGTEPKIKFYFSVQEKLPQREEFDKIKQKLTHKITDIQTEMNLN
ncbi:MAG: phospho-sugar mutase [Flavobacteriales bacterium]|nr:phospho-sugar mutase [Flavobacteriales bacterium]